ncbi:MAG TPA: acyl-CoA dehydrogenase family protein [Nevskiaceae bacterium]|nr:acyl-CoA dehydrogenase family protein [Nevskiaceae bacterium]
MNFEFSSEQAALREQAARLFGKGAMQARALLDSDAAFDASVWAQACEIGLVSAAIPEDAGGLGLGRLELCVIAEEVGRSLVPIPYLSSVLYATEALKIAGGAQEWLAKLAGGATIATVAFAEGAGSWDATPKARVVNGRLSGVKSPVADAFAANVALVSAASDEDGPGYGWWLVALDAPGVTRTPIVAIDRIRKHARVEFRDAPAQRIGVPGAGARLAAQAMDVAAILTAFEQLGGASAVLAMSLEYAKQRKAFGTVIGAYQAVKHRLADLYTRIELARGHCYYGAWALSTDAPELPRAAAGARLAATEAYDFAAEEGVELHGGIGFTWEHDMSLHYRRARLLALGLGSRRRWADRLVDQLAA